MLPKFASHVLHHTQRAAATAQNYALRNVLGLQNQGTSASSQNLANWNASGSSSWGGAGGAKYNTGSRFYSGYNGSGRAITQANSPSANDSNAGRTDDDEDIPLRRSALVIKSRPRPRSSSVHLTGTGRKKRAETFGVLQTVQLHQTRKNHVLVKSSASATVDDLDEVDDAALVKSPRVLVRRNSTAASTASDLESLETIESLESLEPLDMPLRSDSSAAVAQEAILSTDPSTPQSAGRLSAIDEDAPDNAGEPANYSVLQRFEAACATGDAERVIAEVMRFRESYPSPNVKEYNRALDALVRTRQDGQPITMILETYNEMLTRQIMPNVRTYKIMIAALCERDHEVERVCSQLEWRQKRRTIAGRAKSMLSHEDARQLALLRKEDNFGSALLIFEAAQTLFTNKDNQNLSLGRDIYNTLLRSCMLHGNVDAAVRIWAALESIPDYVPDAFGFLHLLGTYVSANDIESARDVFSEFLLASKEGRMKWWLPAGKENSASHPLGDDARSGKARVTQMLIWVKMVEAYFRVRQPVNAIALLEEMMDSKANVAFGTTDVPPPCTAVYSAFINGFVESGDIQSALTWFDRMLAQEEVARNPLLPMVRTPRPDQTAWNILLEALIERKMVKELNEKFKVFVEIADRDGLQVRMLDLASVFELNVAHLKANPELPEEEFDESVNFLSKLLANRALENDSHPFGLLERSGRTFTTFVNLLGERGRHDDAIEHLERFVTLCSKQRMGRELAGSTDSGTLSFSRKALHEIIGSVAPVLFFRTRGPPSLPTIEFAEKFARIASGVLFPVSRQFDEQLVRVYNDIRARGEHAKLTRYQWTLFTRSSIGLMTTMSSTMHKEIDYGLEEFKSFIADATNAGFGPTFLSQHPSQRLCQNVIEHYGEKEALEVFRSLGQNWFSFGKGLITNTAATKVELPANNPVHNTERPLRLDRFHSRSVDEYFPSNPKVSPQMAWSRYEAGAKNNVFPMPDVIGRLIATFGRLGEIDKVHRLYQDGQVVLQSFEDDKENQSISWYVFEDQMIVALAHAGHVEKAHIHRQRIIDQNGNPSADAYGALIQCVRETTDDSTNALALWQESQMRGVVPNLYLYNTIISKLSRARKADLALELFQQMKVNLIRPSSVTYGAIIAACCRVGDVQSAEVLFEEMTAQKNFRPRIPPYNTMIQFYTHIIRDRERALHYFSALLAAGINPSAHTYKLLIDCYGTIEPVDIISMEDVFSKLVTDKRAQVQGVHWAALINAWGCVQKDLSKAMSIFDSIAAHPTTQRSSAAVPDAIVYEAMINVLVTLRRTDLIPTYLERLTASGIHMTAYIANLLIKGYASAGDLGRAREVFESLQDPPVGLAAPNNHAPHDASGQAHVSSDSAVYREPSTWETMVRAELGSGNRDNAAALLQRVQERHFPPAVYARISGIMLDDAVSPWSSTNNLLDTSTSSPS
ncbi:hypothetical protein DFH11DRAFT_1507193 [Phellopilus nigrolimitatus]|nr:hypothetical protein DFH11DRAFT_1507193 [Phellopilus nigrolimitatus]